MNFETTQHKLHEKKTNERTSAKQILGNHKKILKRFYGSGIERERRKTKIQMLFQNIYVLFRF